MERKVAMGAVVQVRNLMIGEGLPKVCVPIMGATKEELEEEAKSAAACAPDMIEWRADFFDRVREKERLQEMFAMLRGILGEVPLIFTLRTAREGGKADVSAEEYLRIVTAAIDIGGMDLADVEICHGDDIAFMLITLAHEKGIKVIASSHDFQKTPKKEQIIMRLCKMQELEADIPKLAVMPKSPRDVLVLLDATLSMKELHGETPLITMSMGEMGMISRISGSTFGSDVTFGSVKKASAPGQIEVHTLRGILEDLGGARQ